MKKLTLAAAALAVLLLASCGAENEQKTTDTTPTDTAPVTEETDSRPALTLEDRDFNGAAWRVSVFGSE